MSRSSQFTFSTSESDHSKSNMLRLDTTPFNPYNFQHSTHHSSAPVLFTPVASTVTPHSDVESLVNGFDLQSYESFIVDDDDDYTWPLDPKVLGTSDTTPFSFYDGGDSVHFSNVSWNKDQLGDFQGVGDSFVMQQPGVTQGISHVFTGDMPREAQWDDNALVLGEHDVLQSIEADFDLSQIGVWNGIDEDLPVHQPGSSQSVERSRVGCDKDIATEYSKDFDGEYETDDEYMSVSVPNGCMAQCPTPDGDWKTSEVNITGAIKSKPKPILNKKSRNGKPVHNQIGDRKKSPVKNTGIKKSRKKGFAGNKVSTTVQYEAHKLLNLSIPEKMRKANIIIGEQKTKASLAEKLGQYIHVVRTESRVSIEGVYWKAPQNDATIPATETAKEECVRQIVAAILNNGGCKEVSTTQAFLNRWGEGANHYTMEELQDAAWQTVVMTSPSRYSRRLFC
jgi:hypothetical protein